MREKIALEAIVTHAVIVQVMNGKRNHLQNILKDLKDGD
jgi:hypothetical protein